MNTDILAKLQAAKTDEERSWIVMQFSLDGLTPELREAVWAAAIPHWFDKAFLDALLQKSLGNQDFETLKDLSYVEKFERGLISEGYKLENGYNVHELTRNLLLEKLWQNEPEQYRELNRRAADYCAKQDQNNTIWRIEYLYHALLAENDGAADEFSSQGIEWNNSPNFAYDKIDALVRPVLEEIKAGRLKGTAAAWAYYRQARLDIIYNRYFDAKNHLESAIAQETDEQAIKANCIQALGDVHRMLDEYDAARVRYEEALPIFRQIGDRLGEANCIARLGDVHRMLDEYDAARVRYEEALPIFRQIGDRLGEANCIASLGDVHRMLDEYDAAQVRYEEALPIFRQIGDRLGEANCIASLGDVHRMLDEYDAARVRYEEALPIYRQIGARLGEANCIRALGDVHRMLAEYDAARVRYEEALPIYRQIGARLGEANCIARFGLICKETGDIDKAIATLKDAAQRFQNIGLKREESACLEIIAEIESGLKD